MRYNGGTKIVVSGGACDTPDRINLTGRSIMDILPQDNTPRKQCTGPCGRMLPATPEYFYRHRGGLTTQCKVCASEKARVRRSHPEYKEWRRKMYSRPEVQASNKAYQSRPEIREHRRALHKAYYSRPEIREHISSYNKDYQSRPGVKERYRQHSLHRIARKKAIPGTYTPQQIEDLLKRQRHKCYYCATKFEKRNGKYIYHIDHTFPLSRVSSDIPANDISYLVLTCPTCNVRKSNKFPWEWPEGGRLL